MDNYAYPIINIITGKNRVKLNYIIIMAYDSIIQALIAGPVASIGFVKDAIRNTLGTREKTIIAVPFYSRLWKRPQIMR